MIGKFGGPGEAVLARNGMHRADEQLEADERNAIWGHRNAPVLQAVVNHKQLQRNGKWGEGTPLIRYQMTNW